MSNYIAPAQHPETGKVEQAEWLDDWYGRHKYGVRFADGKVFPAADVESNEANDKGRGKLMNPYCDIATADQRWWTIFDGDGLVDLPCDECGESPRYADTHWCEDCDGSSVYCLICEERMLEPCRHLPVYMDGVGDVGPGIGACDSEKEFHRILSDAMFRVAGEIGIRASALLAKAFRDHRYHFFYSASLLGGSVHLLLTFRSLGGEAPYLTESMQEAISQAESRRDEELADALGLLWGPWCGDAYGELHDLKATPEWDNSYADAIDAAWSLYGPDSQPEGGEGQ